MNMTNLIVLCIAGVAYIAIKFIAKNAVTSRKIVFAGSPSEQSNTQISPTPKNKPLYITGDQEVDVSNLIQLSIKGKSLDPLGIKDGSTVFVEIINTLLDLNTLIGRFVVFKIDNNRTLQEHPLKNISIVEGALKIRKVIRIIDTTPNIENISEGINNFLLNNDTDFSNYSAEKQCETMDRILEKYRFASTYYRDDTQLIMSITYKNGGTLKDYSFHSPTFLYGIVKYSSL